MGGGIPSIIQACENEREKIIEAKHVFRSSAAELGRFLLVHDKTGAPPKAFSWTDLSFLFADARMEETHPFTLKNVQTLNLILYKLDQLDQFCQSYEEYFGHEQFRHLNNLLDNFKYRIVLSPSRQEYDTMIEFWTHYERFTLHFPNELDMMTDFFRFGSGGYTIRSAGLTPIASLSSLSTCSESEENLRGWRGYLHKCVITGDGFGSLKRGTVGVKRWISCLSSRSYRRVSFWFHWYKIDCYLLSLSLLSIFIQILFMISVHLFCWHDLFSIQFPTYRKSPIRRPPIALVGLMLRP